jgi:hypothetical protein
MLATKSSPVTAGTGAPVWAFCFMAMVPPVAIKQTLGSEFWT